MELLAKQVQENHLIDLLMTLTKPVKGEVLFNENIINFDDQNSLNKIRDLISYVPQTVYLKTVL